MFAFNKNNINQNELKEIIKLIKVKLKFINKYFILGKYILNKDSYFGTFAFALNKENKNLFFKGILIL